MGVAEREFQHERIEGRGCWLPLSARLSSHPDGQLAGAIAEEAYNAINPKRWKVGRLRPDRHLRR